MHVPSNRAGEYGGYANAEQSEIRQHGSPAPLSVGFKPLVAGEHGHEALKGLVLVASLRSSIGDTSDNICAAQVGCRFISSEIITTNQLCKDNAILFERHL
ncbi:hypothetical protein PC123_g23517 [Phytophthora cactorum]|nr:hypothetical protein PC123_g23517 [Phytophthora cactorum]